MTPLTNEYELDTILHLLKLGYTKAKIRKRLDIKPTTLSNRLRRLEDLGCIERKGKYIVKVLRSSHKHPRVTKNKVHIKLNKRGHAFNFKILFPKETDLKEKPKVKEEYKLKKLEKLYFGSLKLTKDKNTIWINKESLTIYSSNSYYSKNALHSKFRALKDIDNLVQYLKDRYGFTGIYGIEIFREHYGLIFNKFANWLIGKGKKMYVKNFKNKTILWVDNSRKDDIGLTEFEGDDPIEINEADTYFESHEKTGWKNNAYAIEQNTKNLRGHGQVIGKSMEVLGGYAKQIALHLKVEQRNLILTEKQTKQMDKQTKQMDKQTKIFKEIKDFIKKNDN